MLAGHAETAVPAAVSLLATLLIARAAIRRRRPRDDSGFVILALAGAFAAGCALGTSAAGRARSACATELETGDLVRIEGLTREHRDTGSAARLTLRDVAIIEARTGRTCAVDGLVVRLDRSPEDLAAGSLVSVRGEWIRMGARTKWPRRPARLGIVLGRLQSAGESRSARPDRGSPVRDVLARARARVSRRLASRLPPETRPIARALLLAERDDVPGAVRARFAEAGLAHLLAISGLHVGLIAAAVMLALAPLLGPARAALGAAGLIAVYVAMIGAPPSAVRASLLLAGWAGARARGLPARPWDLLAAAALLAVVADPLVLVEPGFQLSFAGFAGLGAGIDFGRRFGDAMARIGRVRWFGERWPRWLRRHLSRIGLTLAGGSGAFLATAPFAAAHFQHVAPVALVSHIIGTPLVAAAIGSLVLAVTLPPPLEALGAAGAALVLRSLTAAAGVLGSLPGAHAAVRVPTPWLWAAAGLATLGLWRYARWGRARSALLPLAASVSLALGGPSVAGRLAPGRALLCTLDVGQGDAAVLRTSRGRWILFDAGPSFGERDAGREVIVPFLRRYGARRIDLFVLSHPDQDHVGGFEAVHQSVPVFRILDSGHAVPSASYGRFLARAEEEGIRWLAAADGDAITLDGTTIQILGPPPRAGSGAQHDGTNESSLLLRTSIDRALVYLNTGDATVEEEAELLSRREPATLRADVLKVGHHGSRTSTSEEFLAAVRPALAIVSAGRRNRYGHPHPEVVRRLSEGSVSRLWRTDRDGTLCVEVDREKGWRVSGEGTWERSLPLARVLTSQRGEK